MRRGKSTLTVTAEGGVVCLSAKMPGSGAVFRLSPDLVEKVVVEMMTAAAVARAQFVDARVHSEERE